ESRRRAVASSRGNFCGTPDFDRVFSTPQCRRADYSSLPRCPPTSRSELLRRFLVFGFHLGRIVGPVLFRSAFQLRLFGKRRNETPLDLCDSWNLCTTHSGRGGFLWSRLKAPCSVGVDNSISGRRWTLTHNHESNPAR